MKTPKPIKLKSGDYRIQLRLNGESICVTAPTQKECTRQAALIKAEHLNGKREKKAPANVRDMTLEQVIDAYIKKYRAVLSPATIRGYQNSKRNRFKSYMQRPVKDIKDWQSLINDEIKVVGAKTVKNAWSCLHVSLANLKFHTPDVKLPVIVTKEHPWLDTSDELKPFLNAVKGNKFEIPILMGLLSLRRSEIMAVTWDKVDLQRKVIKVHGAVVPNDENKYVYKEANKEAASHREVKIIIPQLYDALLAVPEDQRTGNVVKCHPNSIYNTVNSICEANNLPLIGTHGLRHSFASAAFETGLSESDVKDIGGWSDPGTVHKIYEHIGKARRLKATNALEQFFTQSDSKNQENATQNATEPKKSLIFQYF